ncbi:extracellular solute-binding protein [Streptomyces sp. NBC_00401]|uniref:extracellular solute-binding protein n=1 Tax=Streptomyces sp. NBC_00401 TaxID=2975738 RepID=UPI00225597FD|nr:extracellular solute-binding protein [Streptomyces sp. NBC_00401]MCX5085504.1 extracellular solute-binding protein [Streptomyces sp. NBC_00401]
MPRSTPINRRTLLRTSLGLGLGLAAAPLLTACGDGGAAEKSAAKSRKVLPSTVTANTVKADLPGTAAGVPNAFYSYPKSPVRSVEGTPLKGAKTVKAITETYAPPAPARGRNAAWQAIEKRLGGTVDITAVAADDYPAKFSTMVAGGDLADVFMYPETGGVDHKAAFLAAECADLTPFLSGDKVKAYPNLAAIPASAWQQALYGDKLYGVPVTRYGTSGAGFYRHDLFKEVGVDSLDQITGLDRFFEVCKELTQPKKKQYAIIAGATSMLAMSAGAPYFWSMDQKTGKFTADLETDEYRSAVEMAAKLYKAGCYYPGTLAMTGAQKAQYTDLFKNGKGAYVYDGMPAYLQPSSGYVDAMAAIDKSYDVRPFVPVGTKAVTWTDNATLSESFVKKAPKARVEQILRLLDFIAAPFGTEEYTLINFGVEGTDFKRDAKGIPVLTPTGSQDIGVPWGKLASGIPALFSPTSKDAVTYAHEAYTKLIPKLEKSDYLDYTSPTWDSKGYGSLLTLKGDGLKDIISGRKSMKDYDALVKDYLAKGGEQCRSEFEDAAQKGTDK